MAMLGWIDSLGFGATPVATDPQVIFDAAFLVALNAWLAAQPKTLAVPDPPPLPPWAVLGGGRNV